MDLESIIMDSGMSARPAYYSGYGAITDNLNSDKLIKMQEGIEKEFGQKASKAMVELVQSIKVLTATAFLSGLYNLKNNNWVLPENISQSNVDIQDMGSALGTLMMAMSPSSNRDQTFEIKNRFLSKNGIRQERNHVDEIYGGRHITYNPSKDD